MKSTRACLCFLVIALGGGCDSGTADDTESSGAADGAVTAADASTQGTEGAPADAGGGDGGDGGDGATGASGDGDVGSAGPTCVDGADNCSAACAWLADCAVAEGACPGFDQAAREGVYEACLQSCAEIPAQAVLVCNQTTCEETVAFARGASEAFEAGCSGEGASGPDDERRLTVEIGDELPAFTANEQAGLAVNLSDFSGGFLIVMLNANEWCPPCMTVTGEAEALWRRLDAADERYRVRFVELLLDGPASDVSAQADAAAWADTYGLTYPVLHGPEVRTYIDALGIPGFPFMILVDPLQRISAYQVGWNESEFTLDLSAAFDAFLVDNPDWRTAP
jgi:peroxiredoxin